MQQNPKVAIITRTRNRSLLLKRAVGCVQYQTFTDYVHVIVNDGGRREELGQAVGDYLSGHGKQVKIVHNEETQGHTRALNQGIQVVTTEYVAILDDDDSWDPEYLEKMIEHLDVTGAKGVVITSDYIVEEVAGDKIKTIEQARYRPDITEVSLYKQCVDNCAPTMGFVYRRDVYDELGGYDEALGVAEDWEFTLRFLLKYDIDFINTDKAYAFYHYRPEAAGSIGNSVFARVGQHKEHLNMLANRYLREDLADGKLGIGYIVNTLRYQREREDALAVPTLEAVHRVSGLAGEKGQLSQQLSDTEERLSRLIIVRTGFKARAKQLVKAPVRMLRRKKK